MITLTPAEVVIDDWHIRLMTQQLAMVYLHRSASRMDNAIADEVCAAYIHVFVNDEPYRMTPYLTVGSDDDISHVVLGVPGPQHSKAVIVSFDWDDTTVHQLLAELPLTDREEKYCNLADAVELILEITE